jgi:hypothetical protein
MEKENWPELSALASYFSVELPGIEPVAKIALNCENASFEHTKRPETTRNDLGIRDRC